MVRIKGKGGLGEGREKKYHVVIIFFFQAEDGIRDKGM